MAATAQIDSAGQTHVREPREQGLPTTLLALLLISLLGTGISIGAFFVPGAVVSALFVALFYGLIVAVRLRDRWAVTHTGGGTGPTSPAPTQREEDLEEIAPDIAREVMVAERAGLRLGIIILAPLGVLALVLATIFVGPKVIGLGALAFFAMMIFMGLPVWLAATEDEIEDGQEKIGVEIRSIR